MPILVELLLQEYKVQHYNHYSIVVEFLNNKLVEKNMKRTITLLQKLYYGQISANTDNAITTVQRSNRQNRLQISVTFNVSYYTLYASPLDQYLFWFLYFRLDLLRFDPCSCCYTERKVFQRELLCYLSYLVYHKFIITIHAAKNLPSPQLNLYLLCHHVYRKEIL